MNKKSVTICRECCGRARRLFDRANTNPTDKTTICPFCKNETQTVPVSDIARYLYEFIDDNYEKSTALYPGGDYAEKELRDPNSSQTREILFALFFEDDVQDSFLAALHEIESAKHGHTERFSKCYWWQNKFKSRKIEPFFPEWEQFERDMFDGKPLNGEHLKLFERICSTYLSVLGELSSDSAGYIGPGCDINRLWRARRFTERDKIEDAVIQPGGMLGAIPDHLSHLAPEGRMACAGDPMFYGAENLETCIAEIRAPVGSTVVGASFIPSRKLRVFDTRIADVPSDYKHDPFHPNLEELFEFTSFLKLLESEFAMPILEDEKGNYRATQEFCNFLQRHEAGFSGIVYDSVQAGLGSRNVALFGSAKAVAVRPFIPTETWFYDLEIGYGFPGLDPFDPYDTHEVLSTHEYRQLMRRYHRKGLPTGQGAYQDFVEYALKEWRDQKPTSDLTDEEQMQQGSLVVDLSTVGIHHVIGAKFDISQEEFIREE